MSYLVLHMDKFKRESLRGIQSHNRRERRSHSNPDIRSEKSGENYELHQPEVRDYARTVQTRIESLNLPKAVRKDAVVLCGLIVTSDRTAEFNSNSVFINSCNQRVTGELRGGALISSILEKDSCS